MFSDRGKLKGRGRRGGKEEKNQRKWGSTENNASKIQNEVGSHTFHYF